MSYSGNPTVKRFKTDMIDFKNQLIGSYTDNMTRQAEELMQNMRGAVPVESGKLRDSIRRKNITQSYGNRNRVAVLVMAGGPLTTHRSASGQIYDYALGIEFGTVDTRAEPFFYPSARRYQQAGRASAAETLEKAIEENNRLRQQRSDHYSRYAALGVTRGGRGGAVFL